MIVCRGIALFTARRYDEAIRLKEAHNPTNELRCWLAASYAAAGRVERPGPRWRNSWPPPSATWSSFPVAGWRIGSPTCTASSSTAIRRIRSSVRRSASGRAEIGSSGVSRRTCFRPAARKSARKNFGLTALAVRRHCLSTKLKQACRGRAPSPPSAAPGGADCSA